MQMTWTILCLTLWCQAQYANSCPKDCHCLPELNNPHQMKITCKRRFIAGKAEFASFPGNRTASLTIHCTDKSKRSDLALDSFSQFGNLRHLKLNKCSPKNSLLRNGLFDGLTKLKTLHLDNIAAEISRNGLEVQVGTFSGLRSLEKLSFTGSQIHRLPRGTFCNLLELKLLNLSDNRISSVSHVGFHAKNCPNQLVLLDLSRNHVTKIGKLDFRQLRSLHVLILFDNRIRSVEEGSFQTTRKMQKLFLGRNFITDLRDVPSGILQLDLSENQLSIIPPVLAQVRTLSKLNISYNLLDSSTPFFPHGNRLQSLDLRNNQFRKIPSRLFENTTSLVRLFLRNNLVESIEEGAFHSLSKLSVLDMANNKIFSFESPQAEGLQNLTNLYLENNSISQMSDGVFAFISSLQRLNLAKNLLLEVPTGITRLYHLRLLDISDNKISTVHKFLFNKLPNLEELNLSRNKLPKVERYVFEDMPRLRTLILTENGIESFSAHGLDRNPELSYVRLENNQLHGIIDVFSSLQKLSVLNLTENRISFVDYSMFPENLDTLLISHNRITQLTNVDNQEDIRLETLDFSFNRLTFLNGLLIPRSLAVANFSHNRLSSLAVHTFYNKPNLRSVDLRGNQIRILNQSSLSTAGNSYYEIFLSKNPLQCTCHMGWLKKQERGLITGMPKVLDYAQLRCLQAHSGVSREILKFDRSDLLCSYDVICSDDCLCCDFDSCDCKNVCPEDCSCYHDSAFDTNIVQCTGTADKPQKERFIPMYATHIYLDDADMPEITRHSFLGRFRSQHLYVNSSRVQTIQPRAFNGLTSLELLDLSDNQLTELRGDEFYNTPKLLHLFLNGNRLRRLSGEAFSRLPALRSLTLHNNDFNLMPQVISTAAPSLFALTLANNPWRCDCNDRFLIQQWLPLHQTLVRDFESVYCFENLTLSDQESSKNQTTVLSRWPATEGDSVVKVNFWTFRQEMNRSFCVPVGGSINGDSPLSPQSPAMRVDIVLAAVIVGVCFLGALAGLIVYRLRRRCLGPSHYKGPPSLNSSGTTSTPIPLIAYDAFVSYSYSEDPAILNEVICQLENEPPYHQLCLLYRDLSTSTFSTCHLIHDDIIRAMERSQTLLMVLTRQFLEQEWEMVQIRTAHQCLLKDKQKRLIVILVGDRGALLQELDPMLGHYLRTSTCLSWSDPLFWDRLREALPSPCAQDTLTNSAVYSDLYGTIVPSNFV